MTAAEVSERLRIARERAAKERGFVAPGGMTRAIRTVHRQQRGSNPRAGDEAIEALRDSNPLAAVLAAQNAYLELRAANLLSPDVRALLTQDYDAALRAVVRHGLRGTTQGRVVAAT